jgi:cytoskeletal protein CcmA (bactofilin family)
MMPVWCDVTRVKEQAYNPFNSRENRIMFSKPEQPSTPASPPNGSPVDDPPARDHKISGVHSIISPDLKIIGDLRSEGDIQIDGTIEGDIKCRALTIGEGGEVKGTLIADTVRIYGSVAGEVKAGSVLLAKTAKVAGNIAHQSLEISAGASLVGRVSRYETKADAMKANVTALTPLRGGRHDQADVQGLAAGNL